MDCFIRFNVENESHFNDLKVVFNLIKDAKHYQNPRDDKFWLENFPSYALQNFYFLKSDFQPDFPTAIEDQFNWHFYSLIELLVVNYELEYLGCLKISETEGQIVYSPYSYPYGGITGLVTFVHSFKCLPTIIDDGTSVYKLEFLSNGDFSITDVEDPKRQNSQFKLFGGNLLLKKFARRFNKPNS